MSNATSGGAAAQALTDSDTASGTFQPTAEDLRTELEQLYRDKAAGIADQLVRRGAKDGMDLVHEAFARLLGFGRQRLASIERPVPYVARVSRNLLTDHKRTEHVHHGWIEELTQSPAANHDPVVYLEARDTLRRLEAAVTKLRPVTRQVFLARRVEGLSYDEISALTGLSHKAIEKQMAKAIAKLSRLIDRS